MATTMDDAVVAQMAAMHSRAIGASAGFQEGVTNGMSQLTFLIASANVNDTRLMNGFLAQTLFADNLVAQKSAYGTPYQPGAAPLATPPSH